MATIHRTTPIVASSHKRSRAGNSYGENNGGCGCLVIIIMVGILFYMLLS